MKTAEPASDSDGLVEGGDVAEADHRAGVAAEGGSAVVLSLRAWSDTPERWSQFWSQVDRWGFPVAA